MPGLDRPHSQATLQLRRESCPCCPAAQLLLVVSKRGVALPDWLKPVIPSLCSSTTHAHTQTVIATLSRQADMHTLAAQHGLGILELCVRGGARSRTPCRTDLQRWNYVIWLDGGRIEACSAEQPVHHMQVG